MPTNIDVIILGPETITISTTLTTTAQQAADTANSNQLPGGTFTLKADGTQLDPTSIIPTNATTYELIEYVAPAE